MTQLRRDPISGISVYIIDVSTRDEVDEEWLNGRNAKLHKGRVVLADNLVMAAVPLRCKPSASAFRVRLDDLERIRAPGEIGASGAEALEDSGDVRCDWVDVSATHSVAAARSGEPARERRPLVVQDRDPTPPPLLMRDGIVHCNRLEESMSRELVFEEQTTARLHGLALTLRSKGGTEVDTRVSSPRTGDTLEIDEADYQWALRAAARAAPSDHTQILSLNELEEVLGAAPMVRVHGEQPFPPSVTSTGTHVMLRPPR